MATNHQTPRLLFLNLSLTIISVLGSAAAGITIDLIHRDSPLISNSTTTGHVDKLYGAFHRSITRARAIAHATTTLETTSSSSSIQASLIPAGNEYLMDLSIGVPPSRFLGIVDSGSDLMWTQCQPCVKCFKQDLPVFNPAKSTSYGSLTCDSSACGGLSDVQKGCTAKNTCAFNYSYDDSYFTRGDLSTETLTIGANPTVQISGIAFGCGHINQGTFTNHASGLIGFGQGPLSLPAQTKKNPAFGGKFAYCLIPSDGEFKEGVTSKIIFGDNSVITGPGVASTAVVPGQVSTFYYLTLEGVSVGEKTIPFKKRNGPGPGLGVNGPEEGNIIMDSGTTLTFLPAAMLEDVVSELKSQIKGAKPVPDPRAVLKLCYQGPVGVPSIKFHFTGATLEMAPVNVFIGVAENVGCLAMVPARDIAIFGNMAQIKFLVSYDIDAKTVRFKPTDCTKFV